MLLYVYNVDLDIDKHFKRKNLHLSLSSTVQSVQSQSRCRNALQKKRAKKLQFLNSFSSEKSLLWSDRRDFHLHPVKADRGRQERREGAA